MVLRKFVCKNCKRKLSDKNLELKQAWKFLRESICIAGNVTFMDVNNHLYITVCQAKEIESEFYLCVKGQRPCCLRGYS